MFLKVKEISREKIAAVIILASLAILVLTMLSIRLLDIKVTNMELGHDGLYIVDTNKGTMYVSPNDILRIERTYTKSAITGVAVELDKIYTNKGFIYLSSLDPFADVGRQMMNSVDWYGLQTWNKDNVSTETVQPYGYAIGTNDKYIPLLFSLLALQRLSLSVGGLTLAVLIFPWRFREARVRHDNRVISTSDFYSGEEQFDAVAK